MTTSRRIVLLSLGILPGCVAANDAAPVVALQAEAIAAIATHSAEDHAALAAATTALLRVRRAALATRLEACALGLLYDEPPDPTIGGLAGDEARRWLDVYTNADDPRREIVSLPAWDEFEHDAEAITAALDARGAHAAALFADLLVSTALLGAYADESAALGELSPRDVLAEIYTQELRNHIDDPQQQAAADRLAALLLGTEAPR